MMDSREQGWYWLLAASVIFTALACSLFAGLVGEETQQTATPAIPGAGESAPTRTPTLPPAGEIAPSPVAGRCAGLAGSLEVKVLVGPSEAVGLEPVAVGSIPFEVTSSSAPYTFSGSGPIHYADVLVEEWGTYEVTMDLQNTLSGECLEEPGTLLVTYEMSGEQMVRVDAGEFQGEYPWSGSHTFELEFPLEDGAIVSGEGWEFVLHLAGQ